MRIWQCLILMIMLPLHWLFSQTDTVALDELIITATKTQRSLVSVPMPASIIKQKEIGITGTSRLQDILSEQAGLNIVPQVNGLGNGIQMQGLNPDYTLILIDGEPLIGRLTGNLELNRITLNNIRKIEIVRGPSSSLYGSEALGGVIHIITKSPVQPQLEIGLKYSSHQTIDASAEAAFSKNRFSISVFGNHYRTQGFDLFPDIYGQTVAPYYNNTLQLKSGCQFNDRHQLKFNAKVFSEDQDNFFQVITTSDSIRVSGKTILHDYSLNPQYVFNLDDRLELKASLYGSWYESFTNLFRNSDSENYYTDNFKQRYIKPELQCSFSLGSSNKFSGGTGLSLESVKTSRYVNGEQRNQHTAYIYGQHEWKPGNRWEVISGLRLDNNNTYGSQWSPKLAMQYAVFHNVKLKASAGTGFKSPDFRYLYLNFRNAAAGYYVFGTSEIHSELEVLKQQGGIQQYFIDVNEIGVLTPEKSFAINVGLQYTYKEGSYIDLNFFRNDLDGLIEFKPVALTTDNKTIYSYSNIKRAFTTGFDVNIHHSFANGLSVDCSSQWLYAKDKDIIDQIHTLGLFGRDPVTKESYRIREQDYFGLYNRSRHMETVKIFYENKQHQWNTSLRIIYKGKFGLDNDAGSVQGTLRPASDANENDILDSYDHFVSGYFLVNASISKNFQPGIMLQLGIENAFNYTDPLSIPGLQGRIGFIKVNYKFFK